MKNVLVFLVCVFAVVVAAVLHVHKKNSYDIETTFDKLAAAAAQFKNTIPDNTRLSLNCVGNDVFLYCRYLYANPYRVTDSKKDYDTVINIFNFNASDSLVKAVVTNKKVLWSGKDESFTYYLTCHK